MSSVPARLLPALVAPVLLSSLFFLPFPARSAPSTVRVSVTADGQEGRYPIASTVTLSHNGRYAVFESDANNLVANDANPYRDVFVRDLETGTLECLSAADGGDVPAGGFHGLISDDGRYAVFLSKNLTVTGALARYTSSTQSLFLRDRVSHTTIPISLKADGTLAGVVNYDFTLSADGRFAAFTSGSSPSQAPKVYLYDVAGKTMRQISPTSTSGGAANFDGLSLSADGRFLAFYSNAKDLVPGDTNLKGDVFVQDIQSGAITRVSMADDGTQPNNASTTTNFGSTILSDDGRYAVFASSASNLVPNDTDNMTDVFVRDLQDNRTYCLSRTPSGAPAGGFSPAISGDGRTVVFYSASAGLLPGMAPPTLSVIAADREAGPTRIISVAPDGTARAGYYPVISVDGARVGYASSDGDITADDTNGVMDAFVTDLPGLQTRRVSAAPSGQERGGSSSQYPSISADGRYVLFYSNTSLLPDHKDGLYRKDRQTGALVFAGSSQNGVLSADGRYAAVAMSDPALPTGPNPQVYRVDLETGEAVLASVGTDGQPTGGITSRGLFTMSADARYVFFTPFASPYSLTKLLRRDLVEGKTQLVNAYQDRTPIDLNSQTFYPPAVSGDGRYVAFYGFAIESTPNGTITRKAIYLKDMESGGAWAIVSSDGVVWDDFSMSADGRYLAFSQDLSIPTGGPSAGTGVYVYDRIAVTTERVSLLPDGNPVPDWCGSPSISNDGRFVSFLTAASIPPNDTNNITDVYVRDRTLHETSLASARLDGGAGNDWSGTLALIEGTTLRRTTAEHAVLSGNGQWVAFTSQASDLVVNDTNGALDVFVRGPLLPGSGITVKDVTTALRIAAGLDPAPTAQTATLDPGPDGRLDLADVVNLCRHLDPTFWPSIRRR